MQKVSRTNYKPISAFKDLKVSAFVGKAGSGKSWRANHVAETMGAEYIIDDGLVVRHANIILGKSAKGEANQIRAIRRALFEYDDHRSEVDAFFRKVPNASVMVIATSEEMAYRICRRLGFPEPSRVVHIEDVATQREIQTAHDMRKYKGQHTIPVSHVFIRRNFTSALVHNLRTLLRSSSSNDPEKMIVRPPFSFGGRVHIEKDALEQIVRHVVFEHEQVRSIVDLDLDTSVDDKVGIALSLKMTPTPYPLSQAGKAIRLKVAKRFAYLCGLDVSYVNVSIVGVVNPDGV